MPPRPSPSCVHVATRLPCDPDRQYDRCCGPLHAGGVAVTAEALMRSRYSAYVLDDEAYLLATWHPDTRPDDLDLPEVGAQRWLGLSVKQHRQSDDDHASVEFVARLKRGGAPAVRLHELSRFVREDGRWFYLDGEFPGL